MAAGQKTLADLIVINNENLSGDVANELLQAAPLIATMTADVASNGTQHQWLRYDNPPVANFRAVNAGRALSHSTDTNVTKTCQIVDASSMVDSALADGFRGGRAAYVQRENMRSLASAFQTIERQVINGTAGTPLSDAAGFDGLTDELGSVGNQVIDASGTTNLTSVYVVRMADTGKLNGDYHWQRWKHQCWRYARASGRAVGQ